MSAVTPARVQAAADDLTGAIEQVPPMVSAVKIEGRRLHELARQGIDVERPPRPVTVYRFDVEPDPGRPNVYRADGRVLVGDLRPHPGRRHGGGPRRGRPHRNAATHPDRVVRPRTTCGCWTGSTTTPSSPRPRPCATWTTSPSRREFAGAIEHGLALDRVPVGAAGDGPWAMVDDRGTLLAVYEATGTDRIKPAVVLAGN